MLRVADIAAYFDICTKVAYRLVKEQGCPLVILTNKAWRIPRDAFFTWMEQRPGTKELVAARQALADKRDVDQV
jgi:predicted site-specific integrase-resolvase